MSLMPPTSTISSPITTTAISHSSSDHLMQQSITSPSPSIDLKEDIEKLLQSSIHRVEHHLILMKKALDQDQVMPALHCASAFLTELRTGLLPPKMYYQLYMVIFDALRNLSMYLDTFSTSMLAISLSDLYDFSQYTGNIIPRLYLMITVGSARLKYEDHPISLITDMLHMMRGVQHPIRGLFLRHYLMNMIKDHLCNIMSLKPKESFPELVSIILENFSEMNRLWIRWPQLGPLCESERRQQERKELEILIGSNIVRLGQLVELLNPKPLNIATSLDLYRQYVLDKLAYELTCQDSLSQEYIFESIIQVFPDEYHLMTLQSLITIINQFGVQVGICSLYKLLIDRMTVYSVSQPVYNESAQKKSILSEQELEERKGEHIIPGKVRLFDIFFREISTWLTKEKSGISCSDILSLTISLQNLTLKCYPNNVSHIKRLYSFISEYLESRDLSIAEQELLIDLILSPASNVDIFIETLSEELVKFLPFQSKISLSKRLTRHILDGYECISNVSHMNTILSLCDPLLDNIQVPTIDKLGQLVADQQKVCMILNLFSTDDQPRMFRELYEKCVKGTGLLYRFTGGVLIRKLLLWVQSHNIKDSLGELALEMALTLHTLPQEFLVKFSGSLPTNAFGHSEPWARLQGLLEHPVEFLGNETCKYSEGTSQLNWFSASYTSEVALRCLLNIIHVYNDHPNIAQNAWMHVFMVYEEGITDSFAQHASLCLIIDTLVFLLRSNAKFIMEDIDLWIDRIRCYSKRNLRKTLACHLLGRCALLYCPKIVSYERESRPKEAIPVLKSAFQSIKGDLHVDSYDCSYCKEDKQSLVRVILCIDLIDIGLYLMKYFGPLLSTLKQLLDDMFAMVTEQSCMKSSNSSNTHHQHDRILLEQQFEYVQTKIVLLKTTFQSILSNRCQMSGNLIVREHLVSVFNENEPDIESVEEKLGGNLSFSSDFNESATAIWRQEQ